jgi:hypothetical protein
VVILQEAKHYSQHEEIFAAEEKITVCRVDKKGSEDNLRVIFDQWPKLHIGRGFYPRV